MRIASPFRTIVFTGFCAFILLPRAAQAHRCSIEPPEVNFGRIDGALLHNISTPSSINLHCKALSKASPVRYCITVSNIGPNPNGKERLLLKQPDNGGQVDIPFQFTDGNNNVFGGVPGQYGVPILGSTGEDKGRKDYAVPFTAVIGRQTGDIISQGDYQNTFKLQLYYNYANKNVSAAELCGAKEGSPHGTRVPPAQTLTVKARAENACNIAVTSSISFRKNYDIHRVDPATGEIAVRCNADIHYQVGISGGNNAAGGSRAMQCATPDSCAAARVAYNLWQDSAYTQPWNDAWNTNGTKKGHAFPGNGFTDHYLVHATIPKDTDDMPAGIYKDQVRVEVRVSGAPS